MTGSSHIQEAWHSFIDANVGGAGSNREPLGQRKEMKIHQGAITHENCCLAPQLLSEIALAKKNSTQY